MTQVVPPQVRTVPSLRDLILRGLLAVAILVPVTVLFGQVWQNKSGQSSDVALERRGVTYLRELIPLTSALSYAESVAVSDSAVDFGNIDASLARVAAVDADPGVSAGAHSRFAGLNTKIQQLQTHKFTSPLDAFNTFSAVTALALALAEEVRSESGLIRDPAADVYFLEDAAALQMSTSIVAAGQYGDLVAIALSQSNSARQPTIGEIAAARAVVLNAATALGNDVQHAVDAKPSETLSGTLPSKLDTFRLAIDSMVPPAALPNDLPSLNDGSMAQTDKGRVELAATALSDAVLDTMDRLLSERADGAASGERNAIGALVLIVLLAFAPLLLALNRRRRARRDLVTGLAGKPPTGPHRGPDGGGGGPGIGGGDTLPRRETSRARELRELSSAPR